MLHEALLTVEPTAVAARLDVYLQRRLGGISRERAQEIIRDELRLVDGSTLKPSSTVRPGLQFRLRRELPDEEPPPHVPIVHDDGVILVVDKPAGLAVHPAGRHHRCTLTSVLAARGGPRADPAHRLDRETSGLLVCGYGREATAKLKAAFAAGTIQKTYLAIVHGWPDADRFTVDMPMELGAGLVRIKMAVGQGRDASTSVEVRRRLVNSTGRRFALVAASPHTGRQHQIRAHLAARGLPVVGDKIYGLDETIFIRFTERAMTDANRASLLLPRQALHAAKLMLAHPSDGRLVTFECPLPDDLGTFLSRLG